MIYWAFPSLSFTIGNQPEKKGANFKKMCSCFEGAWEEFLCTIKVKKENLSQQEL